ncbi:DUF1353 domain-containing protein [Primorskyibacter aestuariivivens]|uniref:DUF1353 domain-containing protein n=1 Tax=Primorskyibacter aestuariivivens TaxID=1888912 RepID=UPI002300665B|nr:DUF1353 domain-containing protein [Primorskyibacter aestuariivivens]MDA7427544.1 DUF1353 domain-containing protein [Primorskyibacter aestuariivivens]
MPDATASPGRTRLWIAGGAVAVALGLGARALMMQPAEVAEASCLNRNEDEGTCVFIGAPLEIEGQPVFLPPKQQAFFPLKGQLAFIDAEKNIWTAPPKTLTDGATIPRLFAPLIGDRQAREYVLAAALHDAYCGIGNDGLETFHTRPWHDVHRMFYEALLVGGTPPHKAKIMFAAVYLGGPRWDDPDRSLDHVSEEALLREMEWCLIWIDREEPTIEQIEAWMQNREAGLINGTQAEPDWETLFSTRA